MHMLIHGLAESTALRRNSLSFPTRKTWISVIKTVCNRPPLPFLNKSSHPHVDELYWDFKVLSECNWNTSQTRYNWPFFIGVKWLKDLQSALTCRIKLARTRSPSGCLPLPNPPGNKVLAGWPGEPWYDAGLGLGLAQDLGWSEALVRAWVGPNSGWSGPSFKLGWAQFWAQFVAGLIPVLGMFWAQFGAGWPNFGLNFARIENLGSDHV